MNEEIQVGFLKKIYKTSLSLDYVDKVFWFKMSRPGSDFGIAEFKRENPKNKYIRKKPAFHAYKNFIKKYKNKRPKLNLKKKAVSNLKQLNYKSLLFTKEEIDEDHK